MRDDCHIEHLRSLAAIYADRRYKCHSQDDAARLNGAADQIDQLKRELDEAVVFVHRLAHATDAPTGEEGRYALDGLMRFQLAYPTPLKVEHAARAARWLAMHPHLEPECTCSGPARDAHDPSCPVRVAHPRRDLGD